MTREQEITERLRAAYVRTGGNSVGDPFVSQIAREIAAARGDAPAPNASAVQDHVVRAFVRAAHLYPGTGITPESAMSAKNAIVEFATTVGRLIATRELPDVRSVGDLSSDLSAAAEVMRDAEAVRAAALGEAAALCEHMAPLTHDPTQHADALAAAIRALRTSPAPETVGVKELARAIYDLMPHFGPGEKPARFEGGNSLEQDEARAYADAIVTRFSGRTITRKPKES